MLSPGHMLLSQQDMVLLWRGCNTSRFSLHIYIYKRVYFVLGNSDFELIYCRIENVKPLSDATCILKLWLMLCAYCYRNTKDGH